METIRIEYIGKGPKRICLPIPFVSMSEKTGEVICNPVGEFPYEDGMRLLALSGANGIFRRVEDSPKIEAPKNDSCRYRKVSWEDKHFKTAQSAKTFISFHKMKGLGLIPARRDDGRWILTTSQARPEVENAVSPNGEGKEE